MRIGSIVSCRGNRDEKYMVTDCNGMYKVVDIWKSKIVIEVVSHKYLKSSIGKKYTVIKDHFYEKSVKLL